MLDLNKLKYQLLIKIWGCRSKTSKGSKCNYSIISMYIYYIYDVCNNINGYNPKRKKILFQKKLDWIVHIT